jgi:hypothetical protein
MGNFGRRNAKTGAAQNAGAARPDATGRVAAAPYL